MPITLAQAIVTSNCYNTVLIFSPIRSQLTQVPWFWPKRREWRRLEPSTVRAALAWSTDSAIVAWESVSSFKIWSEWNIERFLLVYKYTSINWVSLHLLPVESWLLQNHLHLVNLFSGNPWAQVLRRTASPLFFMLTKTSTFDVIRESSHLIKTVKNGFFLAGTRSFSSFLLCKRPKHSATKWWNLTRCDWHIKFLSMRPCDRSLSQFNFFEQTLDWLLV